MGEAGGERTGNLPAKILHGVAGETSPPAFAAPCLPCISRLLFVFCFDRDPHGLSREKFNFKRLTCYQRRRKVMSEKVLLVDDEQDFLEALATRMEDRGMDVSTTTSAADALKKVEAGAYDAVVLDLNMPEMDGLEVLKAMKEKRPELQIILLTGYATVQKGVEAMKFGAMDFIEKPADLKTLTEKIHQASAQKMVLVEKKIQEKIKRMIQEKGW
jgi:FixJ family two-component response regulator